MRRCSDNNFREGFSLLEVTLAMALAMVLVFGIFSVASGTTEMTQEISDFQSEQTRKQAFTSLCRKTMKGLSADAELRLELVSTAKGYLSRLSIDRDPTAFAFSAIPPGAARVVMHTEPMAGGDLAVWLKFLNEAEVQQMDRGEWKGLGTDLRLLQNVSTFEWRFFNQITGDWDTAWEPGSPRPSLVDLNLAMSGDKPQRYVFWIPKYVRAEQLIRGFQQNRQPTEGAETPEDGDPEISPEPEN